MCKVKDCYGDVVEIDELFVPVIAELNRKGYKTQYCCSAHYDSKGSDASSYIYFEDDIVLPSLPEGYMYDQDLYPWVDWEENGRDKRTTIRINFDKSKGLNELSKDILNNAIRVLEWAEGLEDVSN